MGKKAAPKAPLTKIVWQWTETTSPENITTEHVHTSYRLCLGKCNSCRKNCAGNPTCLRGLGEAWWFREGNHKDILEDDIKEIRSGIRKDGEFVGLKNLGATCYVNTFLQLWFHNLNIRKAIYDFKEEQSPESSNEKEKTFPHTVCGHLQLLFGMLQSSKRKNIDPTPFIKCLSLDTELQQDAQEFSKLLLNLLLHRTSSVGKFLCNEFSGEYNYCTTCKTCGNVSQRPSEFYELDLSIQGHKDVIQCLGEFFKEEQLEGENQYHCASCDCKRDASRRIVVKSLPRTLNLQLLRFVFDKTTWNRKKVSSYLSFPDTLDMSSFVSRESLSATDMLYELTAVLIHRGPSASSGHYIAHIKDFSSQLWHMFNDETIEKMKGGKKLDLDTVSNDSYEVDLPQPAKKPKLKNKWHSSKDAYMLVYTKKKELNEFDCDKPIIKVPDVVQSAVKIDNDDFFMAINTSVLVVEKNASNEAEKHLKMAELLKKMHETDLEHLLLDSYWVPTTWIKHMLNVSHTKKTTFTTEKLLCDHKKLNADRVGGMKCIPGFVADHLFAMCKGETPRLTNKMLCFQCIKDRCFLLRFKSGLKEDHTAVTSLLKDSESTEEQYLVGRSSLLQWKTMASSLFELKLSEKIDVSERVVEIENGSPNDKNSKADDDTGKGVKCEGSSDEDSFDFNEDLLCEHGNLTTETKSYRTVSSRVWNILIKYFPDAPMFKASNTTPCQICKDSEFDDAQTSEVQKILVMEQKKILNNLFLNKNRPTYEHLFDVALKLNTEEPSFYVVSTEFVKQWREYIKNYTKCEAVSQVQNQILMCPHNLLCEDIPFNSSNYFQSEISPNGDAPATVLLWPEEWNYISKQFGVDVSVSITKHFAAVENQDAIKTQNSTVTSNDKQGNSKSNLLVNNEVSQTPQNDEIITVNDSALIYQKNDTFADSSNKVTVNITSIKSKDSHQEPCRKVCLKFDPDFCKECMIGKALEKERNLLNYKDQEIYIRKIIPDSGEGWYKQVFTEQPENCSRKSKRVHTTRGGKKILVSSDWTLKQLKIKIMHMFCIAPYDQNIWSQGRRLEDNDATLSDLSVLPGCSILLVADEPDKNSIEMLPVIPQTDVLEEGFKGTGLISS